MATTMQQVRAWRGPAVLSYGFRPFFLLASLHAAGVVALFVPWYFGVLAVPSLFSPAAWHAHSLLFGYVPAVIAGFLMTAVPNWTGRLPVVGWRLAGLAGLWLAGRIAVLGSSFIGPVATALADVAFLAALAFVMGREIVRGENWRNLKVLGVLGVLGAANAGFHLEWALSGGTARAERLAVGATIVLITLIGGRIVPSFTINWLRQINPGPIPSAPDRLDQWVQAGGGVALALWVAEVDLPALALPLAALMAAVAIGHGLRQRRWRPERTLAEPLVTVLHVAHGFVPLGFLIGAVGLATGDAGLETAGLHAWTTGAIGLMTLAVMTRATRGHTGRALTADRMTVAIYGLVGLAAAARIVAAHHPETAGTTLPVAAAAWVGGFALFALHYGRMLVGPRKTGE